MNAAVDPVAVLVRELDARDRPSEAWIAEHPAEAGDPIAAAWRASQSLEDMLALLRHAHRLGLLGFEEGASGGDGLTFRLRTPDGKYLASFVKYAEGAEGLRQQVPALPPLKDWLRAAFALREAIRDPIARLLRDLQREKEISSEWVSLWVGEESPIMGAWRASEDGLAMLDLLRLSGRRELVDQARALLDTLAPSLPRLRGRFEHPGPQEEDIRTSLQRTLRDWAEVIRAAVPTPPSLHELFAAVNPGQDAPPELGRSPFPPAVNLDRLPLTEALAQLGRSSGAGAVSGPMRRFVGRRFSEEELQDQDSPCTAEASLLPLVRVFEVTTLVGAAFSARGLWGIQGALRRLLQARLSGLDWSAVHVPIAPLFQHLLIHTSAPASPDETTGQGMELELFASVTRVNGMSLDKDEGRAWLEAYRELPWPLREVELVDARLHLVVQVATYANVHGVGVNIPFYS